MLYQDKVQVTTELYRYTDVTKDRVMKDLIMKMIQNMDMNALTKLFNVIEKDPFSSYWKAHLDNKLKNGEELNHEEKEMLHLQNMGIIQYEAKIEI